jgi:hypothetical protein
MQLALGRVPLENPVNHKLRVLVRVDVDPGLVTLEVTGCLTQSDYPALLHIMQRAGRLGAGTDVIIDLQGTSHIDPEALLQLRSIAAVSGAAAARGSRTLESMAAEAAEPFRVTLSEPAELPICLLHAGSDGAVLAGLEGRLPAVPLLDVSAPAFEAGPDGVSPEGPAGNGRNRGPGEANNPGAAELGMLGDLELSEYFEGTLDPAATVQALSDTALGQLADALYRHLDTERPSFGAHTWYELAAEELQNRKLSGADTAAEDEVTAGQAIA